MSSEIAECPGFTADRRIATPGERTGGIAEIILVMLAAEMGDGADHAIGDQTAGQTEDRLTQIGEANQRATPRLDGSRSDLLCIVCAETNRFFAIDMLAGGDGS